MFVRVRYDHARCCMGFPMARRPRSHHRRAILRIFRVYLQIIRLFTPPNQTGLRGEAATCRPLKHTPKARKGGSQPNKKRDTCGPFEPHWEDCTARCVTWSLRNGHAPDEENLFRPQAAHRDEQCEGLHRVHQALTAVHLLTAAFLRSITSRSLTSAWRWAAPITRKDSCSFGGVGIRW